MIGRTAVARLLPPANIFVEEKYGKDSRYHPGKR
jgi:hypothetical protein